MGQRVLKSFLSARTVSNIIVRILSCETQADREKFNPGVINRHLQWLPLAMTKNIKMNMNKEYT